MHPTKTMDIQTKIATSELIDKCKVYLNDNFHKFTEANKIKVALSLITKSMPTQLEGNLTFTQMKEITVGNRIQEFIVGDNIT